VENSVRAGVPQRRRPFKIQKLEQLVRLVRESHEQPMTGEPRLPVMVSPGETGVTFLGHSSFLLQIGGRNVLVDPVFSTRLIVLRRQRRPGVLVPDLPPIDLVLITHAHMDHLDKNSLRRVVRATRRLRGTAPEVVVPHGVEDLVEWIGFSRVHGLGWWEALEVAGLKVTMTPCKHWGARMFRDMHRGYGGYVIAAPGASQTVYHSGDTAYFNGFAEVGERLRPDVALLPIGAYFPDTYRAVHTSPEEALRGFVECGAKWMIPMHFGTFRLGREPMEEPVERLEAEARRVGVSERVRVLEEGETMRLPGWSGRL
jgi:L-ascorbate metabolism protein UlaG (beta-lactamase superfamily)